MTSPNNNDSWEMHEEMLKNSEDFYQQVFYAVSVICLQGVHIDLDNAIHMWLPSQIVVVDLYTVGALTLDLSSVVLVLKFKDLGLVVN